MSLTYVLAAVISFFIPLTNAAPTAPAHLAPADPNFLNSVSARLHGDNFTTDPQREPQVLQANAGGGIEIFIINKHQCVVPEDTITFRILVRNNTDQIAREVEVRNVYSQNALFVYGQDDRQPNEQERPEIIWREEAIAPNSFVEYSFSLFVEGGDRLSNRATVASSIGGAATEHLIDGDCEVPTDIPTAPLPQDKVPGIICDPAELGCTQVVPFFLGVNFQKAFGFPRQQPTICSEEDPRGCAPNQPQLGVRYGQARPSIEPGECRVQEDLTLGGLRADDPSVGSPVEVSWCESNGYPEFVVRKAPEPIKARIRSIRLPDTSGFNGALANIVPGLVRGQPCGGEPGDPWWANDCTCDCRTRIQNSDLCLGPLGVRPITRHDIFVTDQRECILDGFKHNDPFF